MARCVVTARRDINNQFRACMAAARRQLSNLSRPSRIAGPRTAKRAFATAPSTSSTLMDPTKSLVWMDLEMTGLDPNTDVIMEVGCLITNSNLEVVNEGIEIAIHHPEEVLAKMNDWCKEHHTKSGLWAKCRQSSTSLEQAEEKLLSFLEENVAKGTSPLAGNSVYMDRLFIMKYMPKVNSHLHYRIVDVSTVKELCRRWYPEDWNKAPEKKLEHRSLEDIKDSITELKFYKTNFFNADRM